MALSKSGAESTSTPMIAPFGSANSYTISVAFSICQEGLIGECRATVFVLINRVHIDKNTSVCHMSYIISPETPNSQNITLAYGRLAILITI